jgi:hypothetical protein
VAHALAKLGSECQPDDHPIVDSLSDRIDTLVARDTATRLV